MEEEEGEDLQVQLKVFKDYKDGDFDEFAQRLEVWECMNKRFKIHYPGLTIFASSLMMSMSALSL